MHYSKLCASIALLCVSATADAQSWRYNGFANQTLINTSDNFMFGRTDDSLSDDYRELALIVNGPVIPTLDASAQFLSRKAGVADDGSPRVDYAFLTWRAYEKMSVTHGLRIGRLKAPIGFYNDSRESPFTRIGVFLPQSVYADRVRNFTMRADEVMYFGEWRSEQWTVSWKLSSGYNNPDKEELADFFHIPEDIPAHFEPAPVWHVQSIAEYDGGRIRFGYSEYDSPTKYTIGPIVPIGKVSSEGNSRWRIISFEYNDPLWAFTGELERTIVSYNGLSPDPNNPDYKDYPEAAYAQLLIHAGEKHSFFVRKEYNYLNRHDKNGEIYTDFLLAKMSKLKREDRYGLANVVGWSYTPTPNWLVRLDLSKNTGTMLMTGRDAPKGYVTMRHWNMAAFAVSWRF